MNYDYVVPTSIGTIDAIYDLISQKEEYADIDKSIIEEKITKLCDENYFEKLISLNDTDDISFKLIKSWSKVIQYDDKLSKDIMLLLIQNKTTFLIIQNTQKGKSKISGKETSEWIKLPDIKVIPIIIVDNDKTLSEQTKNSLYQCFDVIDETADDISDKHNIKIFELSSNKNNSNLEQIITHIDAYCANPDEYRPPLIIALNNTTQMMKVLSIMLHIKNKDKSDIYSAVVIDEADKTYPSFRDKKFTIKIKKNKKTEQIETSFKDLLDNPDDSKLFRVGFVTATEGDLLDDYDECATAELYKIEIDSNDIDNYISINHPSSILHPVKMDGKNSNNDIAEFILDNNMEHFTTPIILKNGKQYGRKIIINGDFTTAKNTAFAYKYRPYATIMIYNMNGITLYTRDMTIRNYKAKGKSFNKLIYDIVNEYNLDIGLLIIIGNRKINRGTSFHYAPRDGSNGLIWTDMIFGGKIIDIYTAVQKAGRGAGIIRQCPQWSGEFHYWGDKIMMNKIIDHYKKIEIANTINSATTSIMQSDDVIKKAKSLLPKRNHSQNCDNFRVIQAETPEKTLEITKKIVKNILHKEYRKPDMDDEDKKYKFSTTGKSKVHSVFEAIDSIYKPSGYNIDKNTGKKYDTYRIIMPSYLNDDPNSLCCVIPLIDPDYNINDGLIKIKNDIDTTYSKYLKEIPQIDV